MPSGNPDSFLFGLDPWIYGIGFFFLCAAFVALVIWRFQGTRLAKQRLHRGAKERGIDSLGISLLDSLAEHTTQPADELLRSEDVFDGAAARYLKRLIASDTDPRETVKDLAWLKRELGIPCEKKAPSLLAKVVLSESKGRGAAEGVLVREGEDHYEIVVGSAFDKLKPGAILELVFSDENKMAGLAAIVREVIERGSFTIVHLASPELGGFRKRAHFRVDTDIPATLLIRSDQVAYMPDDEGAGFRVLPAQLVNLSGGGGRLRLGFAANAGDKLCISFPYDDEEKPLAAEGKIVWARKDEAGVWYAGFEFEPMDHEDWRKLLLFLFRKQSEQVKKTVAQKPTV